MQYPIYCRRKSTMQAPEEILLDENELARGHPFTQIGAMDVSPDGKLLAYTVDFTGFRQYTLHVKDLESGRLLRDTAPRVTSIAWAADSRLGVGPTPVSVTHTVNGRPQSRALSARTTAGTGSGPPT